MNVLHFLSRRLCIECTLVPDAKNIIDSTAWYTMFLLEMYVSLAELPSTQVLNVYPTVPPDVL